MSGIEEERDALARGEALLGVLRVDGFCAAALADGGFLLAERGEQREHAGGVGLLALGFGVELRGERGVEDGRLGRRGRIIGAGHGKLASIAGLAVRAIAGVAVRQKRLRRRPLASLPLVAHV